MWFKNLRLFELTEDFNLDHDELNEKLTHDYLKPCGPQDTKTSGWISPFSLENKELLTLQSGDCLLVTQAIEEKVLPAAVVNQKLQEQLVQIRDKSGHKPGRKKQSDLKQEIIFDLLPRAFTKIKKVNAYIDNKSNLLLVDSATQNPAEDLVSQLRKSLGSFKVSAFGESTAISNQLTKWVSKGSLKGDFQFGSQMVLESLDDSKSVIRAKNVDIQNDEFKSHIDNGYLVTQLELLFNDRIEMVLTHDFAVKSIKFTDIVLEQLDMDNIDSEEQLLDSRFTLMSLEFRDLVSQLFKIFREFD